MAIYALADLHLSLGVDKPMHIFGPAWADHEDRIRENWISTVREEDTVLIPGDISWAMSQENSLPDLTYLHELPGRKILSKGNHDYWWGTLGKVRTFAGEHGLDSLAFLKNNAFIVEDRVVCGARGWLLPNDPEFGASDRTILERELGRLRISLTEGVRLAEGKREILVMLHFPPASHQNFTSPFTEILESYGVRQCVYGHLHGRGHKKALEGVVNGVDYRLASGDYIAFKPLRL